MPHGRSNYGKRHPLRSLTSAEIPGVFVAGRCLSATHRALASVRVMGTCFATGQAAGMAAALYVEGVTETSAQALKIQEKWCDTRAKGDLGSL